MAIRLKYAWYASGGGTCSNVIDAIVTIEGNSGKILYLVNADKLQFKKIIPGDRLELNTNILSFKRGYSYVHRRRFINNELAYEANFTLYCDYIKQFSK